MSGGMLRKPPCESFTSTSVAPASKAPAIAALASCAISTRARSYSGLPWRVCSWGETPAPPLMWVEIRTFMSGWFLKEKWQGRRRQQLAGGGAVVAVAPRDGRGAPQRMKNSLLGAVGCGLEQSVEQRVVQHRDGRHGAVGAVGHGVGGRESQHEVAAAV